MPPDAVYRFGPFEVDPRRRRLARDGQPIAVPGKAFDVLVALLAHRGRVIEKDELLQLVWPGVIVEEGNLSQHVFTLRKLLGDTPDAPAYVATVPRRGYQFIAEVEERKRTHATVSGTGKSRSDAPASLAVLPFAALTFDPADHFLGYGIADAVITHLRRQRRVAVRSSYAIARFVAIPPDIAAAGRELEVDRVLHGAVQKRGEWIRVTAQLVDVHEQSVVWASHWEATIADIGSIEKGVVAQTLTAIAPCATSESLSEQDIADTDTRLRWMKGRFHLARRTPGDLAIAIEHLDAVATSSPLFAEANASLGRAYVLDAIMSFDQPVRERRAAEAARRAAHDAVTIESSTDAHAVLAEVAMRIDRQSADAESYFTSAIRQDADNVSARHGYAVLLHMLGRESEADLQRHRAAEIDSEAARFIQPNFSSAAITCDDAHRQCVASNRRPYALGVMGYALGRDGRREATSEIVAELLDRRDRRSAAAWVIAYPFIGSGDYDRAFEWLARGAAEGGVLPACVEIDPLLAGLYTDPRFVELRSTIRPPQSQRRP